MNRQTDREIDLVLARKLQKVGEAFHLEGPFFSYEEINQGNVNHTYKVNYIVDDGTGMAQIKTYLAQKVNTYAFKYPVELMENIDKVTAYMLENHPEKLCLQYYHTTDGKSYLEDDDGFWRICNYVPSVTFDTCDDLHVVRSAGEAFGGFQNSLQGFDASGLFYTIPDFHNTRKRYEKLIYDLKADPLGRAASAKEELDWLLSMQDRACKLTDLYESGVLPLRVTHNDTKINNVLFDENTHDALIVIDLDTVMPGLVGHDFGDAVRFAANFAEEDSKEPEKAGLDLNVFWAFADGFLKHTAKSLTQAEVDTLADSCLAITCELAVRFLDDYLVGDRYFKIRYPDHNLVRTRCQIALAKDMLAKLSAMDAIVKDCVSGYKN